VAAGPRPEAPAVDREGAGEKIWLSDMTYAEVAERLKGPHVAVLPVGATEQHGRHLPLDVDARLTTSLCAGAARAVAGEISVVVAPPLPFGVSEHHMPFPGTLSLSPETFISAVFDLGRSLVRHGFDRLVLVNGHGGNAGALHVAATKLRQEAAARHVLFFSHWALVGETFARLRETGPGGAAHGCEFETSLYLHLRPELVDMDEAVVEMPPPAVDGGVLDLFTPGPYTLALGHGLSKSGVLGDPTLATAEKGRRLYDAGVRELARVLEQVAHLAGHPEPGRG
jgi:creatinine amidohydrolase